MKGFGRQFWLQLVHYDQAQEDQWIPWNKDYENAAYAVAILIQQDSSVEYGLILDGKVKQGEPPKRKQVLASVDRGGQGRDEGAQKILIPAGFVKR